MSLAFSLAHIVEHSLSKVKETKAYTSIRSEKSSSAVAVGDFKYLGDDEKKRPKKIASTEKVLREIGLSEDKIVEVLTRLEALQQSRLAK